MMMNNAQTQHSSMKLSLSLKAQGLTNVAGVMKGISDPYATVTIFTFRSHNAQPIGKTEAVKNSLSPDWAKSFPLEYELGSSLNILVNIFDEVSKGKNIPMGSASFDVNEILGSKGNMMAVKMKKGGKLIVRLDKLKGTGTLRLQLSGSKLKNVESGVFGKSDPFFQLMRKDYAKNGFEWNVVHRSEVVKDNLNPTWKEDTISLSTLCAGDTGAPLLLTIADYNRDGKHTHMGQVETSVNGLVNMKGQTGLCAMNNQGKVVGTIVVRTAELSGIEAAQNNNPIESQIAGMSISPTAPQMPYNPSAPPMPYNPSAPSMPMVPGNKGAVHMAAAAMPAMYSPFQAPPPPQPSFTDYLGGGCEIQLGVAIDFTGSNGDPRQPGTLHHINPNEQNDYEKAITAIGGVLANYDTDRKFPVWGFGAKYSGKVYHLFQCGATAEVDGVPGIIEAYQKTFQTGLIMSSPTVITQVVDTAAAFARKGQEEAKREGKLKYSILLILTDGAVSDMNATIASIRAASDAPLSIVIVGIGSADFSSMQHLDDRSSEIDIVQFVEFNAHRHDANSLTQATLHEIPGHLVGYFQRNGIQPSQPVQMSEGDIHVVAQEEEIDLSFTPGPGGNVTVTNAGAFVPPKVW